MGFSRVINPHPLPLLADSRPTTKPLPPPSSSSLFLGSTRTLRPTQTRSISSPHRRSAASAVAAKVSDVKLKSTTNLLVTKEEGLEVYEDSVVSTYRDHVHALSKGVPARAVMSELFGKTTGCCRGQGGSMHMFSAEHNVLGGFAFIGEGIPVATGAAFTSKYKREVLKEADCDHVTLAFFGDGTANNGQFFECLNMAALWKLPIIFVVENNLWAIGMSHLRATSDPEIWKKGPAFGMPGVHVDGMDVLKVREVAKEAIGRARRGEGPTLVECETYRFRGHSLADPDELRDPDEKARYAARDPITQFKKYLIENKLASEAELKAIEKKIDEVVEEAVEFADESPAPSRSQLLENVFADPRGFGIGPDGRYRCEDPKFTEGTAQV
ncbi:putative pyruvate dehydrogenase (acetyl-transferring) [Helianthus annuus]|nr:putative pyruvate dehydrogenase (acetyl-transferring) [Helianthus annuus]